MASPPHVTNQHWVALGTACRILEVNQATLRQWADRGLIRAYRTPGGHRRFSTGDLYALLDRPTPHVQANTHPSLDEKTLLRIRRRLHSRKDGARRWRETIDAKGRARLRLFGRRLLTLVAGYLSQPRRRAELLAEARIVGEEYGNEMTLNRVPLSETVRAFIFFRNSLAEAAGEAAPRGALRAEDVAHRLEQVRQITDEVLLAVSQVFERRSPEP